MQVINLSTLKEANCANEKRKKICKKKTTTETAACGRNPPNRPVGVRTEHLNGANPPWRLVDWLITTQEPVRNGKSPLFFLSTDITSSKGVYLGGGVEISYCILPFVWLPLMDFCCSRGLSGLLG